MKKKNVNIFIFKIYPNKSVNNYLLRTCMLCLVEINLSLDIMMDKNNVLQHLEFEHNE